MKQTKLLSGIFVSLMAFVLIVSAIAVGAHSAYAAVPSAVNLRTSGDFIILTESGITNTGSHTSALTGTIGSSPITAAAMDNVFCSEITGKIFGVDATYTGNADVTCFKPGTTGGTPNADKTYVDNAIGDMHTAYTDAKGRPVDFTDAGAGNLAGLTLSPGVYTFTGPGNVIITNDVTLNGSSTDVWIFQIPGTLDISSGKSVHLTGGAVPSNVFWAVTGATTFGTTSTFEGIILGAGSAIALQTGSTLHGRALSQFAVTLDASTVLVPVVPVTPVLTTITLSPESANLTIGATQQLNATSLDQFNNSIVAVIAYLSNDTAVATVNSNGLVTAVAFGSATITASNGSVSDSSAITVPVVLPVLNAIGSKSVTQSELLTFTISATGSTGTLTFSLSGKPLAATFTDNGNGTASFSWTPTSSDAGTTNLGFSVSDGLNTDTENVTVTVNLSPPPTTIVTNPSSTWVNSDFNVTLSATGFNGSVVASINYTLNGVAGQILGSTGNVLVTADGNNTITFYAVDTNGNTESTTTVHALLDKTAPNVTVFTLSSSNVFTGETITGTCTSTDSLDSNPVTVISGIDTSTAGTKTATCTSTDAASNTKQGTLAYTVNAVSNGGGSNDNGGGGGGGGSSGSSRTSRNAVQNQNNGAESRVSANAQQPTDSNGDRDSNDDGDSSANTELIEENENTQTDIRNVRSPISGQAVSDVERDTQSWWGQFMVWLFGMFGQ